MMTESVNQCEDLTWSLVVCVFGFWDPVWEMQVVFFSVKGCDREKRKKFVPISGVTCLQMKVLSMVKKLKRNILMLEQCEFGKNVKC